MSQLDINLLWILIGYSFVVLLLMIEIIREERHASFKLSNGKVETLSASAGIGAIWWLIALGTMSCNLQMLEKNGHIVLLSLLIFGSLVISVIASEIITQFIVRRLFTDVEFADFFESFAREE